MRNAEWERDVHRRRSETQGQKERLEKLKLRQTDEAAEAEEEEATIIDRSVTLARAQIGLPPIYVGQFPHGWGMGLGSPAGRLLIFFYGHVPGTLRPPEATLEVVLVTVARPRGLRRARRPGRAHLRGLSSPPPWPFALRLERGGKLVVPTRRESPAGMQGDSVMHDIIASGSVSGVAVGAGYYVGGGTDVEYGADDT
jgi:hypothetical protein